MQSSDKPKFVAILNGLAAIKPGAKLTPEAYDVWWMTMQEWPLEEFSAAAAHLAKSVEFMPSPFHFEQLRKAGRPTAGEAWARALHYVRTGFDKWDGGGITRNKLAPPDDPAIARAARAIGGYDAIAHTESSKLHFLEKRFCEHYETLQDVEEVRQALPGIASSPVLTRLKQVLDEKRGITHVRE